MEGPDLSYIAKDLRALAVPVKSLQPDPDNAREHSDEQIEELLNSIRLFGQQRAVVAKDGVVRAGSGVLVAMMRGGFEYIACSVTELDDEKLEAYAIADNRLAERSTWQQERLAGALQRAKARGFDLQRDLGFSKRDVGALLARIRKADPDADGAAEPARTEEPRTKPGDLIKLGVHRLYCGDSFSVEDRAALLLGESVDMVITDPPFAIYGSSTGIGRDIADDKMVRPFFENLFRAIAAHVKEFGHVYVHCDWRSWAPIWNAARSTDVVPKNCIVWDKGDFGMGSMYGNAHEFVGFFARQAPAKAMTSSQKRGNRTIGGRANIMRVPRVAGDDREHNAAKPVALLEELLAASSDPGDSVLDLFGGSGSTMIAAERSGRVCYMLEIDPRWCDVIVARWERHTGQAAVVVRPND